MKAYPEVQSRSVEKGFSTLISKNKNIYTSVAYSVDEVHTKGTMNFAYDIWLQNYVGASGNSDEIMIWLDRMGGAAHLGSLQQRVTISKVSWDVYKGEVVTKDKYGNITERWNVFSFVRVNGISHADLNIKYFISYLRDQKKWLSDPKGKKCVSSVAFGTEIYNGTGQVNLSKFEAYVK